MTPQFAIRCVGASHLLQPPLTLLLAKRLGLAPAFLTLPPLPAQIARNMAFASVFLPTSTGVLVGLFASEVTTGGFIRYMAGVLAAFWTWRLSRQIGLRPFLPPSWHWGLIAIFCTQGPLLAILLFWAARS